MRTPESGRNWLLNIDGSPLRSVVVTAGRVLKGVRTNGNVHMTWNDLRMQGVSTTEILIAMDFLYLLGLVNIDKDGGVSCS